MTRRQPFVALAALVVLAAGCGSGTGPDGADAVVAAPPASTLPGVGRLPDTVPPDRAPIVMVPPPVRADGTDAELLGATAAGNRILLIGDSIMASTSSRYGGQMCAALVPLGWQVAVEAEPSRFIDFGNRVLDKVLVADAPPESDWNAAVVFLGSNYGGDEVRYEAELRRILDRLAPRPTLLFTVTEYRPTYVEVNEIVGRLAAEYDNVTVIDWRTISATPGVLSGDRLHPTETGREVLARAVAEALGPVGIGEGACLKSAFRDDSAINRGGGGGSSVGGSSTAVRPNRTTTTTVRPPASAATTTTVGTSGGGSGGGATPTTTLPPSGGETPAPTTTGAPPTTAAATTTAAPTTLPPQATTPLQQQPPPAPPPPDANPAPPGDVTSGG